MTHTLRITLITLISAGALYACADGGRGPTSPSATLMPRPTVSWECGRPADDAGASGGWEFLTPAASCPAVQRLSQEIGFGAISAAPANLRSTVTGTTVRLDWDSILEPVTSFLIEAGSGPGLANLATLNTGSPTPSLNVANVPAGEYYVRVRAVGADAIPGPASNEVVVRVGASCSAAPGAPLNFVAQVTGNQVNLSWTPASSGDAPTTYVVHAGSASGLSNIVVFETASAVAAVSAVAPNGIYYTRIHARNRCGTGAASNEVVIAVGEAPPSQPPAPAPPAPTPPVPPPPTPSVPPVTDFVSAVTASVPVVEQQVVPGPPPRPDAAAGPVLGPALVTATTPSTRTVRLSASRPFNRVIVSVDTDTAAPLNRAMIVATAHYRLTLASAQTSVELTITIPAGQSFTAQFGVTAGDGPPGNYAPIPVVAPPASELPVLSCAGETSLRSLVGTTTASIEFVNATAGVVRVYWLNYEGRRVFYQTLAASGRYVQPTFITHPWVVTDAADRCRAIFLPEASRRVATVR